MLRYSEDRLREIRISTCMSVKDLSIRKMTAHILKIFIEGIKENTIQTFVVNNTVWYTVPVLGFWLISILKLIRLIRKNMLLDLICYWTLICLLKESNKTKSTRYWLTTPFDTLYLYTVWLISILKLNRLIGKNMLLDWICYWTLIMFIKGII